MNLWTYIKHYGWMIIGAFLLFKYVLPDDHKETFDSIITAIIVCLIATAVGGSALYIFTKVPFIQRFFAGNDMNYSPMEKIAAGVVLAGIFLGIYILFAAAFFITHTMGFIPGK